MYLLRITSTRHLCLDSAFITNVINFTTICLYVEIAALLTKNDGINTGTDWYTFTFCLRCDPSDAFHIATVVDCRVLQPESIFPNQLLLPQYDRPVAVIELEELVHDVGRHCHVASQDLTRQVEVSDGRLKPKCSDVSEYGLVKTTLRIV